MLVANAFSMLNVLVCPFSGSPIVAFFSLPKLRFSSPYLPSPIRPPPPSLTLSMLLQNKLSGPLPIQLSALTDLCVSE